MKSHRLTNKISNASRSTSAEIHQNHSNTSIEDTVYDLDYIDNVFLQSPDIHPDRKQILESIQQQLTRTIRISRYEQSSQHSEDMTNSAQIQGISLQIKKQASYKKNDERTQVKTPKRYPYLYFCKIKTIYIDDTDGNQHQNNSKLMNRSSKIKHEEYEQGMGALIGQRIVLTAAHVVAEKRGKRIKAIQVKFQCVQHLLYVDQIIIHPEYLSKQRSSSYFYDIAFLVLKPNAHFKYPQKYLSIKWNYSLKTHKKQPIKVLTFQAQRQYLNLLESDDLPLSEDSESILLYRNTTNEGDSGSLILLKQNTGEYKIIGIHIGDLGKANCCLLLNSFRKNTKDIFAEIIQQKISKALNTPIDQKTKSVELLPRNVKSSRIPPEQLKKLLQNNGNYLPSYQKEISQLREIIQEQQIQISKLREIVSSSSKNKKAQVNVKVPLKSYQEQSSPTVKKTQKATPNTLTNPIKHLYKMYLSQSNRKKRTTKKGDPRLQQSQQDINGQSTSSIHQIDERQNTLKPTKNVHNMKENKRKRTSTVTKIYRKMKVNLKKGTIKTEQQQQIEQIEQQIQQSQKQTDNNCLATLCRHFTNLFQRKTSNKTQNQP